jgi:hypothetical protein
VHNELQGGFQPPLFFVVIKKNIKQDKTWAEKPFFVPRVSNYQVKCNANTQYTFETLPYRAEGILPYQTLESKVKVRRPLDKKYQQLSFEYLYEPDFCYSSFVKAMQQMTTWYLKFKRVKKTVDLPL